MSCFVRREKQRVESIDSIFNEDRLLDLASQHCLGLTTPTSDLSELLPVHRHFLLVYTCQPVVQIGGIQYFFEADWPGCPAYEQFSESFQHIGAYKASSLVTQAIALFPFANPHLHRLERVEFLRASCVEYNTAMGKLSSEMMDQSEEVFSKLAAYVTLQPECFGIA